MSIEAIIEKRKRLLEIMAPPIREAIEGAYEAGHADGFAAGVASAHRLAEALEELLMHESSASVAYGMACAALAEYRPEDRA